ncbi:hypothetical protein [Peribacillus simplex]|uniref:hypothetical protein n=1 Tax=Peribacillus simplex TaxID=1478 RepID=UPI003CFCACAB
MKPNFKYALNPGAAIAMAILGAVISKGADKVLTEITGVDPVTLSIESLDKIADIIKAAIEERKREDYIDLIESSHLFFSQYQTSRLESLLEDVIYNNNIAITGLRKLGAGAIMAWITAINNIISAYVILGEKDVKHIITAKNHARTFIPIAKDFLEEAREHNWQRVTRCTCNEEGFPDTYWRCCFFVDGIEQTPCSAYKNHDVSLDKCSGHSQLRRKQIMEEGELRVFQPIEEIFLKWEEFAYIP